MQDVFEAVYAGVHQNCQNEQCPCRELSKPLPDATTEEVARLLMVEHGLTIEEARAALLMGTPGRLQEVIRQVILARGYIADRRLYTKHSVYDLGKYVMGIHPLYHCQMMERIQQELGLDEQTMQYGGSLSLEQVEHLSTLFAQSGFSMRTITRDCMDCGKPFEQFPHPSNEQAFYYACPDCRKKRNETIRGSNKGWGDAYGVYRSNKHN